MKAVFVFALAALAVAVIALPVDKTNSVHITDDFIEHINSQQDTWVAGHNSKFASATFDDIKGLCGVLPGEDPNRPPVKFMAEMEDSAIPEEFDSRTAWPECPSVAHIRDQGPCGSCWAFGGAEAMSDRVCIQTGGKTTVELSTEDLVSCCGWSCGMGCNGGYPSGAWSFWVSSGLVAESDYPYAFESCEHHVNGTKPPCPSIQPTPKCNKSLLSSTRYHGKSHYSVSRSEKAIQQEIMTNGPVEAAFTVYEDFPTYKSGVYKHTSGRSLGGHAIRMIGWGVENGTPYWLIANSWNEDWGYKGLFKILRGSNHCGIESSVVAGLAKDSY
eukprot:JP446400.1.p1 GENE.JP446400.1~~JP446400.1.p1  ORF type:complete len:345 (+),score=133.39 JP446400.1:50-1036(+)